MSAPAVASVAPARARRRRPGPAPVASASPPALARAVAWALALACAGTAAIAAGPAAAAGGDPSAPGAYCPLPEKGQPLRCLGPAQAEYGELFAGLDRGTLDGASADRLEAELRAGTHNAVVALSALTWAYYTLMEQAARDGELPEPVAERLGQWNELVSAAYAAHPDDAALRDALELAAVDLHLRAGADSGPCALLGEARATCRGTTAMLRSMGLLDDPTALTGIRGALARLLMRVLGEPAEAALP